MKKRETDKYSCETKEGRLLSSKYRHYRRIDKDKAWASFYHRIRGNSYKKSSWTRPMKYAAAIFVPLVVITLLFLSKINSEKTENSLASILPGSSQAILVLPNGQEIELDSTNMELLSIDATSGLNLLNSRADSKDNSGNIESDYNTLLTRRGGEYRLELEDGTRIHLNANSKLKYPPHFSTKERTVYLEGEAYFEVAHDDDRPFFVITNGIKVKQYGTSFNINAYQGQNVEVVLVEGSIGLILDENEQLLQPGYLAEFHLENKKITTRKVDVETYTAWNDGRFSFDDESLKEIMDILSRWYNIDILFTDDSIGKMRFTGSLDRYESIEPIMQAISKVAKIKVEMKNHTLHISH